MVKTLETTPFTKRLKTLDFWRNAGVHFCLCSLVGRWMEIPWCLFMQLFGIYDPDSLVWDDLFYPFCVYGVAAVVLALFMWPVAQCLKKKTKHPLIIFFVACMLVALVMELSMGLLMNQPDEFGVYPLWDNSILPFNVFNQAWLPNDIGLGLVATIYTWWVYPWLEEKIEKMPRTVANVLGFAIIVGFVVLCVVEFS